MTAPDLRAENDRLRRELDAGAAENAAYLEALTEIAKPPLMSDAYPQLWERIEIAHAALATPSPRAAQLLALAEAAVALEKVQRGTMAMLSPTGIKFAEAVMAWLDGAALDARAKVKP